MNLQEVIMESQSGTTYKQHLKFTGCFRVVFGKRYQTAGGGDKLVLNIEMEHYICDRMTYY
jgi:hypothetical protein